MSHIESSTIKNNFSLWQAIGLSGDQQLAERLLDRGFYRIPMDKFNTVKQILKEADVKCKYKYLTHKIVKKSEATHFSVFLHVKKKTKY